MPVWLFADTVAQYRYSVARFRRTLITAAAMTAVMAGLAWMLLSGLRQPDAGVWALGSAAVFFVFVSVPMLWRYLRAGIVLSVQPAGLFDARVSPEPISWESMREIVLRQAEDIFILEIHLWQPQEMATDEPAFRIELDPLDAPVNLIVRDVSNHARVRNEAGFAASPGLQ